MIRSKDESSKDNNQFVTIGQLERALDIAFEVFFVRMETMVDAKIDANHAA